MYRISFLGAFAKLRKASISCVMSVRLFVCPHGTTRLPLDGFSWIVVFEYFSKNCREDSRFIKIGQCVHCVENVACGNILHTLHTSCHPTLQHHNSYNRTDNYRQLNAVGSPDDGHKDARNMLRYYWLPVNHYVCLWQHSPHSAHILPPDSPASQQLQQDRQL